MYPDDWTNFGDSEIPYEVLHDSSKRSPRPLFAAQAGVQEDAHGHSSSLGCSKLMVSPAGRVRGALGAVVALGALLPSYARQLSVLGALLPSCGRP